MLHPTLPVRMARPYLAFSPPRWWLGAGLRAWADLPLLALALLLGLALRRPPGPPLDLLED